MVTKKKLTAAQAFYRKVMDLLVVEWSESQQCFHIDYLSRTLRKNQYTYHSQHPPDWLPVGIAASWELAQQMTEDLRLERRFREPNRVIH